MHSYNLIVFLCGLTFCFSQNLVVNPSFEEFYQCPTSLGNFENDLFNWTTPSLGTTDFFHKCSETMAAPKNYNGTQPVEFGSGYAGFYVMAPDDYREYIQVKLNEKLTKGTKYKISFYVSLAEQSEYSVREFQVLFSNYRLEILTRKVLSKMLLYKAKEHKYHEIEITSSQFYNDSKNWMLIEKEFVAKGSEQFMTIGNFKNNKRTRKKSTKRKGRNAAYYYVDMVLLESAEKEYFVKESSSLNTLDLSEIELNNLYVFSNVFFEFDEYKLTDTSKEAIKKVFEVLNADNSLRISLEGHTDSMGNRAYNELLSVRRANSIANYLIELGISKSKIVCTGFGGSRPVASNSTENGRQKNRRVEFKLTH